MRKSIFRKIIFSYKPGTRAVTTKTIPIFSYRWR